MLYCDSKKNKIISLVNQTIRHDITPSLSDLRENDVMTTMKRRINKRCPLVRGQEKNASLKVVHYKNFQFCSFSEKRKLCYIQVS